MTEEKKKYTLMNTIAALSISTLLYLAAVNAPTLAYLVKEFPQYDVTTIKLFATIPSLMMIVCSLVTGKLIEHFPIKNIAVVCASIMCVAGFGSMFVYNLPLLLVLRVVYGMGSGTVFPLANAVIQQLYEGDEKAKLLGYRAAFGAIFGSLVTMLGGWLTSIGWRYAFLGYLLAIPVLLLIAFCCPTNEPIRREKVEAAQGEKKYTSRTFIILAWVVIYNACMMSFNVELSLYIIGEGIGDANAVSIVAALNTVFAFFAGLVFGKMQIATKRWMAVISTGLVGISLIIGCLAPNIPMFIVAAAIFGFGFGLYNPTYNLLIASTAAKPKYGSKAIAIYTSCVGLGQFLYPYMVAAAVAGLGLTGARAEWNVTAVTTVVLVALAIGFIMFTGGGKEYKSKK